MAKGETWKKWKAENARDVTIRFNVKSDADILDAIEKEVQAGGGRSAALKRWIRAGIELDKKANK